MRVHHVLAAVIAVSTAALAEPETTTKDELAAWIVRASTHASGGSRHLSQPVADAMAGAALADSDVNEARAIASIEVSLAWFETGGQLVNDPRGPNDGGQSNCWAQIYLPNHARTTEGWTGAELRADPKKCATVAVRMIKASLARSPSCNYCGLTIYARGRDTEEGRRLSRVRLALAERLLREVSR